MVYRAKQWPTVLIAALVLLVWFPGYSQGEPVTLDATARGWYATPSGSPTVFVNGAAAGNNYFAGHPSDAVLGNASFRNWFGFDLAGLSGTVSAATLLLANPPGGFNSVDQFEQYTIFDVTSSFTSLGSPNLLVYSDLGSGTAYGSYTASIADNASVVEISLNAAAVGAIQASFGSQFALGGAITTLDGLELGRPQSLFGASAGAVTQLRLDLDPAAVPEPSTLLMLSTGTLLALVRRRKAIGFWRRISALNERRRW
jgi:hypothetical protein